MKHEDKNKLFGGVKYENFIGDAWETPLPFNNVGSGKLKKKSCKRGDPKHFGLIMGGAEGFFHV